MICIINCGTAYLASISKILAEFGYSNKTIKLDEINGRDFQDFSGIIITGAPTNLTEIDLKKFLPLLECIKKIKIPILGICFGHQLIGVLHGAKISRGKMINGYEHIEVLKKDILFSGIKNHSAFKEEHTEYVDVPEDFFALARSSSCKNEAMKHKDKNIYGTQFHPEISDTNGKIVIGNFLKLCSGEHTNN